jgi:predicted nucleotidyltransferase
MAATLHLTPEQRERWLRRWASEAAKRECRRRHLLEVAGAVATELRAHWPKTHLWQFGSTLGPGFHTQSDLDLAIAQLPADDLMKALDLAQQRASQDLERLGLAPVRVDLVRLEALPPTWRQRIERHGRSLG